MTLLTVSSVKGAPGGTTLALLLAKALGTPAFGPEGCLLVECDPAGGDVAPLLGLPGVPGLASLALAARHGLTPEVVWSHTQSPPSVPGVHVVAGVAGPEQGRAVKWLMSDLAGVLDSAGLRSVVDLGRLQPDDGTEPLRSVAATNLIVTRDDVASLLHTRSAVDTARGAGWTIEIVVCGERTHRLEEVARATGTRVVGCLRRDAPALASLLRHDRHMNTLGRRSWRFRRAGGLGGDVAALVHSLMSGAGDTLAPVRSTG